MVQARWAEEPGSIPRVSIAAMTFFVIPRSHPAQDAESQPHTVGASTGGDGPRLVFSFVSVIIKSGALFLAYAFRYILAVLARSMYAAATATPNY